MTKDNSAESKSFFRELKSQIRKDQLFALIKKHQKITSVFLVLVILLSISFAGWSWFQQSQAKQYSKILHQSLIDEQNGETEKSTIALQQIYQSSAPVGVKQIASLRYAANLIKSGKNQQAIDIYLNVNKNTKFDQYVREYAGLIALKILVDNSKSDDRAKILSLEAQLEKNSKFLKYQIIEQKGLLLWSLQDFKAANEVFESIASNIEASDLLKKRAVEMVNIYKSKFLAENIKNNK